MRYAIEEYDVQGQLKAPLWLWLGWFFLAKAWVIFGVAAASRDDGAELLEILYPYHSQLYTELALGSPALLLIWLMGLRTPARVWLCRLMSYGREITLSTILCQLTWLGYQIYLNHSQYHWASAINLVGLLWLTIYLLNSHRVRDCFITDFVR